MPKKMTIGVDKLHYALITEDNAEGTIYSALKPLEGVVEIAMTVEKTEGSIYADDMLYENFSAISAYNVAIDMASLSEEDRAIFAGHEYDEATKTVIEKSTDVAPEVGLAFRSQNSDGTYKYIKLFKGKFVENGETYRTKADKTEYQTKKLEGKFTPRVSDSAIKKTVDSDEVASTWFTNM